MRSQDPKFAIRYQIALSALSRGHAPHHARLPVLAQHRAPVVAPLPGAGFGRAGGALPHPFAFTRLVEQKYRCRRHRFDPPHRSTYNSDVEAVHGLMEEEFYALEHFRGELQSFLDQAWAYQLWFNYQRENSGKGCHTPDQVRTERAPWVHPKVYALPPVLLSSLSAPPPYDFVGH